MSSVSCVRLRSTSVTSVRGKLEETNVLSAIMWTMGALLVSFNVEMKNNTGIQVSATLSVVLAMLIATLMLGKGLKECNPWFVLPWMAVSFWSMYQLQFLDICKIYKLLLRMHGPKKLPWISLGTYAISLLIRFHLTMCVAYVALQQWYNKKLANEVKQSMTLH